MDRVAWRTSRCWTTNGNSTFKRSWSGKERKYKIQRSVPGRSQLLFCPRKLFAQNISSCAEAASRAVILWLMKGDALHDGSVAVNTVWEMELLVLLYVSKELPRERASFCKNNSIPEAL